MWHRGPKALDKPAQGKRGTSATLGIAWKKGQSPEGAAHGLSRPFRAMFILLHGTQGGIRVRRGLALGWLVSGLWPVRHIAHRRRHAGPRTALTRDGVKGVADDSPG